MPSDFYCHEVLSGRTPVRVVAETEHLPTAAKALGVSAPGLSRSVKLLEDALGEPSGVVRWLQPAMLIVPAALLVVLAFIPGMPRVAFLATGVAIVSANFGGTTPTVLEFDALGGPLNGGTVEIEFQDQRYRVTVAAFTGRVTVQQI